MDSIIDALMELINSAQNISDSGFDLQAFLTWKALAFVTLLGLLGPFNYYTRRFCNFTSGSSRNALLAGNGVLEAVKEQLSKYGFSSKVMQSVPGSNSSLPEPLPWVSRRKKWYSIELIKKID
jgi:hypothetical protein